MWSIIVLENVVCITVSILHWLEDCIVFLFLIYHLLITKTRTSWLRAWQTSFLRIRNRIMKHLCINLSQIRKRARSQKVIGRRYRTSRHETMSPPSCAGLWESSWDGSLLWVDNDGTCDSRSKRAANGKEASVPFYFYLKSDVEHKRPNPCYQSLNEASKQQQGFLHQTGTWYTS